MKPLNDMPAGTIEQIAADLRKNATNLSALGVPYSKQLTVDLVEAGKRASDTLNDMLAHHGWWDIKSKWMAFALADGSSDGVLYDNKKDCVRRQRNEFHFAYICFIGLAQGATPKECAVFIKFNRDAYRAGFRMPDPDDVKGGRDIIMTSQLRDRYRRQLGI
jgi:hypothetical protein